MNSREIRAFRECIELLEEKLKEAQSQIEALTLDLHVLTEELEIARRPKMDER